MKNRTIYLLFLIIILASFLRLYKLGEIPAGLSTDEATYLYNSYSIFKTGKDVNGKYLPLSINAGFPLSPVPVYITAPFVGILGLNSLAGRLPFVILGIASVFLLYSISKILFNNRIALISSFALAVSPWHIYFSRTAYDSIIALFFFLLATYVFLRNLKNGKYYLSAIFFFLAFHSFHATKIFFLFYIILLFLIFKKEILFYKKAFFMFVASIFLIFLSFLVITYFDKDAGDRERVFLWNDLQDAVTTINWERDKNTAPFFIRNILSNKPLYFLRTIKENYFEAFSTNFLFLYGEPSFLKSFYAMKFRGQLYAIEMLFILLGFAYFLSEKNKRIGYFIIFSLLISPLPSAFTTSRTYAVRAIMMLPFLMIFIACGISYLFSLVKNKNLVFLFLFCSYLFSITLFSYEYFFQFPVYGAEGWLKSANDMTKFITQNEQKYKNIYIADINEMEIFHYAIYTQADFSVIQKAWLSTYPKRLGKITLYKQCFNKGLGNPLDYLPKSTLYFVKKECFIDSPETYSINNFGDPIQIVWKIYVKK
ncbi:MAG: glycosyltransferase family 39 protein [Candidatus Gottesmanbacteria bacterium]